MTTKKLVLNYDNALDLSPPESEWPYENVCTGFGFNVVGKMQTLRRGTVLYCNIWIPKDHWPADLPETINKDWRYDLQFDIWTFLELWAQYGRGIAQQMHSLNIRRCADGYIALHLDHPMTGPIHTRIHEDGRFSDPGVHRIWPKQGDPGNAVLGLAVDNFYGFTLFVNVWSCEAP